MKFWPNKRHDAAALLERIKSERLELVELTQSGELRLVPTHPELQAEVTRLREPLLALIAPQR